MIDDFDHIIGAKFSKEKGKPCRIELTLAGEEVYNQFTDKDLSRLEELLGEMLYANNDRLLHGLIVALETYLKK